jgi:hypothetical protein
VFPPPGPSRNEGRDLYSTIARRRGLIVLAVVALVALLSVGALAAIGAAAQTGPQWAARTSLPDTAIGSPTPEPAASATNQPGTPTATPAPRSPRPTPTPAATAAVVALAALWQGPDGQGAWPTMGPDTVATPAPTQTPTFHHGSGNTNAAAMKVVVIVGPSGDTENDLVRGEAFAQEAESFGMNVTRIYHPHATWDAVVAASQGANILAYFGHGNGWPSPYPPFQEKTKDGFGLDTIDGADVTNVTYYGGDQIRKKITLAPNSIVVLSHLCYSAGNGEPGMAIPDWTTAWQRVDNSAAAFLYAGARDVFAIGTGSTVPIVDGLMSTNKTMDEIFMTPGARPSAYYGFVGWDDQYADSVRMPGNQMHLDPDKIGGFERAITGDLSFNAADWRAASGG